ncbi:MAG TPA: M28 family metallopeptidase [Armatimonadota bacterium]|jgi:aminopeptidase YwaD
MTGFSPERLGMHLRALSEGIGVRLAGTEGERRAAEYIAQQFQRSGAGVTVERFPIQARRVTEERLEVEIGGQWRAFPCSLFSSTPGTDGPREAPLVFFEAPTEYQRPDLSRLTGKAVVHLGCHIESREHYRRLMEAQPAFLLFVDIRYPGAVPLADGMFPSYTRDLGACPTVNVAFMDAWNWKVEGAARARLMVSGGPEPAESQNVIAELPGNGEDGGLIFLGAHHDTQANSPGADDNASGVAGLIELAGALAAVPRRRAIRIISFGAEEQLSMGSAAYVRRHRAEIAERGQLMFNLDSYGSVMGWTHVVCNGAPELASTVAGAFARRDLYPAIDANIVPYADHFPFVAAGIPGMYLGRSNCAGGRFFHHRPDDDMSRVSAPVMAEHLAAVADLISDAALREVLPFPREIPEPQRVEARRYWDDLFGGW